MRTVMRLAAVGLAVGVGLAAADPPATPPPASLQASVSLDWAGPPLVRRGRPNPYTLTVTNTGRTPAQRVTVQARPPADATVTQTVPSARVEDGVLVWDVGTLAPGEAKPLALTVSAGQRGDLTCPAWVTFSAGVGMLVKVSEPKLEVVLKAPDTVAVGDVFEVGMTVTNAGDTPLEWVDINHVTATSRDTSQIRPFAPGKAWNRQITHTAQAPGELTFSLSAAEVEDKGVRAEATARVRVIAPKLIAAITGPDKLLVGRPGRYTVTVRNVGELAVADAVVTVPVPAGLRATGTTDGKLSWPLGTLAPGDERTVRFTAVAAAVGVQPVTASVTGSRGATAAAECRTAVDGVSALRVELLDTVDPVEKGQETVYEVRVTNTGTKADENVTLVCEMPSRLTWFVNGSGPTGHSNIKGIYEGGSSGVVTPHQIRFDPIRELAPKTEAVFRVTVKAVAAGDVRFKAVVTSKHLTTPVVKEESTRVYGD